MSFIPPKNSPWRWLYPGLGVKRWLILLLVGITSMSLGIAYAIRGSTSPILYYAVLRFLPTWAKAVLFSAIGILAVAIAVQQINRSIMGAFLQPGQAVVDVLYEQRQRRRGPRVVVIGGGTGLSALLRGLKHHTENITAIVTVADDGGSSGKLRRALGVPPPGDFRNCIAALADDNSLTTQLLQYRFGDDAGVDGHSLGNLMITAMVDLTGSFEQAIVESGRVLAIRGQIVPSTLEDVTLCANVADELTATVTQVQGESAIPKTGKPIERVYLQPNVVHAYPGALQAIFAADLIVAGPGSLYTSVLPNLLVKEIAAAIRAAQAMKVYICNVATQRGETDHFTVGDHIDALIKHVGPLFDYVLANDNFVAASSGDAATEYVRLGDSLSDDYYLVTADLVNVDNARHHDSRKLARELMKLYYKEAEPKY